MIRSVVAVVLLGLVSCATVVPSQYGYERDFDRPPGQLVQGLIGATLVTDVELEVSNSDFEEDDTETLPMIGGVFMIPLRGNRKRQIGFEVGFTTSFQGDVDFISAGGGGAVVVVDNDLFLLDGFAGLYFNRFFGDGFRFYAGAGPLLQYGEVDVELSQAGNPMRLEESAFGVGLYARTGLEIALQQGVWAGFGVRLVDSHLDLSGGLSDLDYQAIQYAVTVTTGF